MARFKLGNRVAVQRDLPWTPQTSYGICRELLAGYEKQGFKVDFQEEAPPERITAALSRRDGTRLTASVGLSLTDGGAHLELGLTGTVVVGGAKGMFATESIVRKTALERLEAYLEQEIRSQSKRIPADGEETKPIMPEQEPTLAVEAPSEDGGGGVEVVHEEEPAVTVTPEEAPAEAPKTRAPLKAGSVEYRLEVLQLMLDRGLIDDEDFAKKKKDILLSL